MVWHAQIVQSAASRKAANVCITVYGSEQYIDIQSGISYNTHTEDERRRHSTRTMHTHLATICDKPDRS